MISAYALVRATEDTLRANDYDGAAKHWVIAATTEERVLATATARPHNCCRAAARAAAVARRECARRALRTLRRARRTRRWREFRATVAITNAGWDEWRSDGAHPVHVSYHWLKPGGGMVEFDGLRSNLPRALGPNQSCDASMLVRALAAAGDYVLAIDLVKEGVTWFSEAGKPWHTEPRDRSRTADGTSPHPKPLSQGEGLTAPRCDGAAPSPHPANSGGQAMSAALRRSDAATLLT